MIKVSDVIDGKYQVTRVLGMGGMGMVVEAYHEALDTHVAIKFMRMDMVAASGGTERFLREARALVKLKSQHAVKVHDMGVHRKMPYIVMEHLEGMDMQTVLDKHGPMAAAEAARHIRQACEALAEAHSQGIYHRDLKPANLFLARGAGDRIIVKVLDFGIAKIMSAGDAKPSKNTSLTGANILIGTLPFMSPEQITSPKNVDARSDIWSLGVVLHELVTGELPFRGQDTYEVQQAILHETTLMPAIPSSLAQVIRRCLEKNPNDRFQSAVELAVALRAFAQESFSPFGTALPNFEPRAAEQVVIRSATKSPLPVPGVGMELDLAVAEGLAPSKNTVRGAETVQVGRKQHTPNSIQFDATLLPESDDAVTQRKPVPTGLTGTLIMNSATPEPPTVKRSPSDRPVAAEAMKTLISPQPANAGQTPIPGSAPRKLDLATTTPIPGSAPQHPALAHFQKQVVPVRRGVLVVEQPLNMARRRKPRSLVGRVVMGAVMLCILFFGWNAYCDMRTASVTPVPDASVEKAPSP
ncbi:MAG TPA: protein kinase [Polyangium sp.]|nr:protein kinase [Polyangium sp.]